jgi:DNA-binding NarL/FixJ family response regulator
MNTKLSSRELEVAKLLGQGHQVGIVASMLGLSRYTVNTHVTQAFEKVKAHLIPGTAPDLPEKGHRPKIVLVYRYAWNEERPKAIFADKKHEVLSDRESEVATLLASGYSARQVARRMGITTYTVNAHIQSASLKLGESLDDNSAIGAHSRIYILVRYAFDRGLAKEIFKNPTP